MLKLFNTLTNQKEEFVPINEGKVNIYVCGPTVYNHIHIGNARPVIVFDVVKRYLQHLNYDVKFVSNITDVDDKIIKKAIEENVTEEQITNRYIESYLNVLSELNIAEDVTRPKVTENMDEIIDFIKQLVDQGYAYEVNGDVYFRVSKIEDYGQLSNQKIEDLVVGARIDANNQKENAIDFTLWKTTDEGIQWDSPWGMGRPGWHTECVVMIDKIFNQQIDIHGGGMDLKFPHHENEVAQCQALHHHTLAKYWMHNGFVNINDEKMSKSLGNFLLAKDLLERYGGNVIKLAMHKTHYRQPINFSDDLLIEAEKTNERLNQAFKQANVKLQIENIKVPTSNILDFEDALNDDFNTPNALTVFLNEIKLLNNHLRANNYELLAQNFANVKEMAYILGLVFDEVKLNREETEIYKLWNEARINKDFQTADKYRNMLIEKNIL